MGKGVSIWGHSTSRTKVVLHTRIGGNQYGTSLVACSFGGSSHDLTGHEESDGGDDGGVEKHF